MLLRMGMLLLLIAGIAFGVYLYQKPQVFDGTGEVTYSDESGHYQLLLSYVDTRYLPLPERLDSLEIDGHGRVPSCLFVNSKDNRKNGTQNFMQRVRSVTTEFIQPSDSAAPMLCSEPLPDDAVPEAALTSSIDFFGESAPAELLWTINMKNGDIIRLRQGYTIEQIKTYDYYPEDVAMNTTEDLQALINEIEQTVESTGIINIHLPPLTYNDSLVIKRPMNLYGSTNGEQRTTFMNTVRFVSQSATIVSYFQEIDFIGDSGRVGVASSTRLHLMDCTVSGWKTGFLAYGEAWVNLTNCQVENNGIGFHFNSTGGSVSHTLYAGNRFLNNGTAVLFENVPSDALLSFSESVFSGNGTDIDNRCNQPIDISEAIFE